MKKQEYIYKGVVKKVLDGDTYDILFDLGFHNYWQTRVRLYGVDAYEKSLRSGTTPEQKELGLQAKALCEELMLDKKVVVETIQDKKGKYGRYLVTVYVDGVSIADILDEKGYLKNV